MAFKSCPRRPGQESSWQREALSRANASRDPYAAALQEGTPGDVLRNNNRSWLWVPAFAGTTCGWMFASNALSPSLPRRDDLDLVAVRERRLRPAAFRQHVVVQRDRKMRALIVELGEQRIDASRRNLARLAVDDHAHCITSLSITPRST